MERSRALRLVKHLGATGTPLRAGLEAITVGLDPTLDLMEREYLDFLADGLSSFKLVVGSYGGGKTHFLYSLAHRATSRGAAASYVVLSPSECPFDRLELVYRKVTAALSWQPEGRDTPVEGIGGLLEHLAEELEAIDSPARRRRRIKELVRPMESPSMRAAVQACLEALVRGDDATADDALIYLQAEGYERAIHKPLGIWEAIDKTTAFRSLRSFVALVRSAGATGLVLLLDEAERMTSMASSRHHRVALDNLRQLIDECGAGLEGVLIAYAVPGEESIYGKPGAPVYEALHQRIRGIFSAVNPSGVRILLDRLEMPPEHFLRELGERLATLFERAQATSLDPSMVAEAVTAVAKHAYGQRFADISYRRIFVKEMIHVLYHLRARPEVAVTETSLQGILDGTATTEAAP